MPIIQAIIAFLESIGLSNVIGWVAIRRAMIAAWQWVLSRWSQVQIIAKLRGFYFTVLAWALSDDDVRDIVSEWLRTNTGLDIQEFTVEGAKDVVGRFAAQKINDRYNTNFDNLYPPEHGVEIIIQHFITEIINVINGKVDAASLQILSEAQANIYLNQIINAYKNKYGYPTLGNGIIQTITPERAKNKQRQAAWRIGKPRVSVWQTPDAAAIVLAFKEKIDNMHAKKKEWKHALGVQHKYERQQRYWVLKGDDTKATQYANLAEQQVPIVAQKLQAYQAAQAV